MISYLIHLTLVLILSLKFSINLFYVIELKSIQFVNYMKYNNKNNRIRKTINLSIALASLYLLLIFLIFVHGILTNISHINQAHGIFALVLVIFFIMYALINPLHIDNITLKKTRLGRKIYFESSSKREKVFFRILKYLHIFSNILVLSLFLLLILN